MVHILPMSCYFVRFFPFVSLLYRRRLTFPARFHLRFVSNIFWAASHRWRQSVVWIYAISLYTAIALPFVASYSGATSCLQTMMSRSATDDPEKILPDPRQHQPLLHFDGYCPAGDNGGDDPESAVNAWLKEKSYQVVDISYALHQRIDAWRYATWQIYDNIAATSVNTASGGLQATRLKQDVYYLEKPRRKTEALIFGSHDSSTLEMTQKMSIISIFCGARRPFRGRCTISTAWTIV